MPKFVFVPEWNDNAYMRDFAERRRSNRCDEGLYHGLPIRYLASEDCDAITFEHPAQMRQSLPPMRALFVVEDDSPVTSAADGVYEDGGITAYVETYDKDGTNRQRIRVRGIDEGMIDDLLRWFDDLVAGNKADKHTSPSTAS